MDEVEKERIRQIIKAKNDEFCGVGKPPITPERQAEIDAIMSNARKEIVTIQTGPNEYRITTRAGIAEELAASVRNPRDREHGVIFDGKLTKGILMVLPAEAYLMSNVCHEDGTRIFGGEAGPIEAREQLWKRLRALGVTGRLTYIFKDADCGHAEEGRRRLLRANSYPERQRA